MALAGLLPTISVKTTILTFIVLFITYWIYKILVRPLIRMKFYAKQGIATCYFPLIGKQFYKARDLEKHDDLYYWSKFGAKDRNRRGQCTNFGSGVVVSLFDPALIKEFFLHQENYVRDTLYIDIISVLEGQGLFVAEGDQWKVQRKVISNAFNFEILKSILGDIQVISQRVFKEIQKDSLKAVPITHVLQDITAEVMGATFFGADVRQYHVPGEKSLTRTLGEIMNDIGDLQTSPVKFILGSWIVTKGCTPKYARAMKKIKAFRAAVLDIIQERRIKHESGESKKPKDMIDMLLEWPGQKGGLSNDRIADEFITFFAGGTDTTSHLLTNATLQLISNPECKEKLLQEIKEKYNPNSTITIDEMNNLEYTGAFIKETFRTLTSAPGIAPRLAIKDHKILDITIRKGDCIDLEPFYNYYNPKYFPDPNTFKPERWLVKNPLVDPYTFTPFSAGPRNCIGQHLALNEMKIILCEYLLRFDIAITEGFKVRLSSKFMYTTSEPLVVDLTPRSI